MSGGAPPFTPATAPRQGGKPGRRAKLSAQAMQILDRLQADWMKHGAATLKILRLEQPQAYAKLALETAARLTLAESAGAVGEPTLLVVRWGGTSPHQIANQKPPLELKARVPEPDPAPPVDVAKQDSAPAVTDIDQRKQAQEARLNQPRLTVV